MKPDMAQHQTPPSFAEGGKISNKLTRLSDGFISLVAVLCHVGWIALVLVILSSVVMRYIIGNSLVSLEELQWHIFGIAFMLGLSYALVADEHVRVDIVADRWSPKTRAIIEIICMVGLVMPFALVIAYDSISFVQFAIKTNEISQSPGGLTHRWIPKSFLPISLVLLALAALTRAYKMWLLLKLLKQHP